MALKAIFPPEKDTITVAGLYQWDYGQELEIDAEGLPEVIEVHFSCTNMAEAIVRTCVRENGVYTVSIPDDCLEQTTPITAWIYNFAVTQGKTVKVITLPVVARTRPSVTREVSADDEDHFAQLVTDLNEAVRKLQSGEIKVKEAENADVATTVNGFTGKVDEAAFAQVAQKDYQGNVIHSTYVKKSDKKSLHYRIDTVPTIYKGATVVVGSFPSDNTVNDIVSIGLNIGLEYTSSIIADALPANNLRFSGVKIFDVGVNPTTGFREAPFHTTATAHTKSGNIAISSMDVTVYVKNNTLYLKFDDGFYAFIAYANGGSVSGGMESIPASNPYSEQGFLLGDVCICLA